MGCLVWDGWDWVGGENRNAGNFGDGGVRNYGGGDMDTGDGILNRYM
jgi:hypothetical protein